MTRLALPLCALAALGLAGCTTYYDPPPTPVTTTSGAPVVSSSTTTASTSRTGFGIVESISLVTPPASAAAGSTQPPVASGPYRIMVRMDDGYVRTMTVDNRAFLVGDRVQVLSDGRLVRS